MAGRRRSLRLGHVLVTLEDLLILSWRVEAGALGPHLPGGLVPQVYAGSSWISVLSFRNVALRPAKIGFPRISGLQLNVRSYVEDPRDGRTGGVFFHGFHPRPTWLAWASARLFGTAYHGSLPFRLAAEHGPGGVLWRADSPDGAVDVRAHESVAPVPEKGLLDLLTNVHTGYVPGRRPGTLRRWSIWHRDQTLRMMMAERARVAPLERLGLGLARPDLAFYVEDIDYEFYLPARPVPSPS